MTDQHDNARAFGNLHRQGKPLVLYNIWDAGSARAVAQAGAAAIATGSWSVAAAQGYDDGEAVPLEALLRTAGEIVRAVEVPVSVDFEGGYAVAVDALSENVRALIGTGAVGLNFEDQILGGKGMHNIAVQAGRIAAIRKAAEAEGVALFINARTDLFLQNPAQDHGGLIDAALARAGAFADAGADGFFVPGLSSSALIAEVCAQVMLPVNVMKSPAAPAIDVLADCGVARISHGPFPYRDAMQALGAAAAAAAG